MKASARTVANRCTAERGTWVCELRAHLSRSRVLRALDDEGEASKLLRQARDLFAEVEATGHVERIAQELDG